jgi:hypothetical protein
MFFRLVIVVFFGLAVPFLAFGAEPEIESNDSFQRANPLKAGQAIQAAMAGPSDKDVFIFSVARESLVTLSFKVLAQAPSLTDGPTEASKPAPPEVPTVEEAEPSAPSDVGMEQAIEGLVGIFFGNTQGFPWRFRVSLYSAPSPYDAIDKVDFFFGARVDTHAPQQRTIGLKPGVYVIEVGPILDLPWVRNQLWSDLPYEIGISMEPASPDRREIEPNNTLASAQRIMIGNEIAGSLTGSSDKDFYRFRVDQPGYLKLSFSHELDARAGCSWQIDLSYVQGEGLSALESLCAPGNVDSLERVLLLNPGEYVLSIHPPDPSAYSSLGYDFSIALWKP